MKKLCLALLVCSLAMTAVVAVEGAAEKKDDSQDNNPWIPVAEGESILTMQDVSLELLQRETEKYQGTIFEDRFKFYQIYRNREEANPDLRHQVIVGKTHFTASPVLQSVNVIKIQITPAQDAWIRSNGIRRQDVIKARVRFAGVAPGGALAFDLLEIEESARSWLLRQPGD